MNNELLVVVQCRYNSNRLRGKGLYPLAGVPILPFLLRRLKAGLPEENFRTVLATSESGHDDIIEAWGEHEGVPVIRGAEEDLLSRYMRCLDSFAAATVARVTADNPLTCTDILRWLFEERKKCGSDYLQCRNLPTGAGPDLFSAPLLKGLHNIVTDPAEREHINLHLLKYPERFRASFPECSRELARPDLGMTVDTKEDWLRLNSIFLPSDREPWLLPLREAIERMDKITV